VTGRRCLLLAFASQRQRNVDAHTEVMNNTEFVDGYTKDVDGYELMSAFQPCLLFSHVKTFTAM